MKMIEESWKSYLEIVLADEDLTEEQIEEHKKAFYSGCLMLFTYYNSICAIQDDKVFLEKFSKIQDEINQFAKEAILNDLEVSFAMKEKENLCTH